MLDIIEKRSFIKNNNADRWTKCECILFALCVLFASLMYARVFFGTEISDEAYYISDAIAMIHGNIPYAYNNYSYGTGSAFLIIPQVFLYEVLVPSNQGIVLFTRLSYITFWIIILISIYRIIRKKIQRMQALLFVLMMIPCHVSVGIFNYSYNSIPFALTFLCGFIIFDAVETESRHGNAEFLLSGFLMGIAVFAHPGYGLAVIYFCILIVWRKSEIKRKLVALSFFLIGGIIEIMVVMIPIIFQVGVMALYDGFYQKFHPYPTDTVITVSASVSDKVTDILSVMEKYLGWGGIFFVVSFFVLVLVNWCLKKGERNIVISELVRISLAIAILGLVLKESSAIVYEGNSIWRLGFVGIVCVLLFIIKKEFEDFPMLIYIGVYPVLFALGNALAVGTSVSVERFGVAVPALAISILLLLEKGGRVTRSVGIICMTLCALVMQLNAYKYVYRDNPINELRYKVQGGVYKGLYTTETRANDLLELEEYLNSIVEEDEYYAFRDNVPCGYLMMHKGVMCCEATWDKLNYSYNRNAPANLYNYYQRRGAFPEKIIYVDYGRDEKLSIEDTYFKYNEFVDSYYKKIEDISLNSTFYHIIVYEYQDTFDGNFEYWIDRHMVLVQ